MSRLRTPYLLALLILTLCVAAGCSAGASSGGPTFGLYWYGKNDASQLAQPDVPNPYYDPEKPTLIFVHGWQPDAAYTHRTLIWDVTDPTTGQELTFDLAAPWIDAGWNVGVFDWGVFADEGLVFDAETKIWVADGPKGMRWRDPAGNYQVVAAPTQSASELFFTAYTQALADYRGPEIRIAGHSLGNQMATSLVRDVIAAVDQGELPASLVPTRLALLDPYWSPLPKSELGDVRSGELVRQIIADDVLPRGILVEWYRSSLLTNGGILSDANEALQPLVVFSEMRPTFCKLSDQVCKHEAAWHQYLLSFGHAPPSECELANDASTCAPTGRSAALASTPNARLAEMLRDDATWLQVIGPDGGDSLNTPDTADDWYARVPRR